MVIILIKFENKGGCGKAKCPSYTYDELWDLEVKFWEGFKYPANVQEAESINSTLFAEDVGTNDPPLAHLANSQKVLGRVDITRNFVGQELNTEYLFGLFTDPESVTLVNLPVSYKIVKFAANDYIAAASTVINFTSTLLGIEVPITIDTFITWDEDGRITQYDATFKWFDYMLQSFLGYAGKKLGTSSAAETVALLTATLSKSICQIHDKHCTGANQQYDDNAACVDFLTNKTRFGQGYELGLNTLLCRSVHQQMVQYRPDVHCPHIGPSGGGMCVDDESYEDKVLEDYFKLMPFVVPP